VLSELLIRFVVGGLVVAAFAVLGDILKPKSFAGLFGAAPSVALATLVLTFASGSPAEASVEGRSMLLGGVALLAYCPLLPRALKGKTSQVWLAAIAGWVVWLGVALGLWWAVLA